jgi:hypothetical protein
MFTNQEMLIEVSQQVRIQRKLEMTELKDKVYPTPYTLHLTSYT